MMRALKCACGLGVEGGHRIANWLLEAAGRTPANYELRLRRQKRAPNGLENQGRPKHKAIPLLFAPLPSPRAKGKIKAAAGKIDQCGETPRLKGVDGLPFSGWRAECKGMALLCRLQNLAASGRWKKISKMQKAANQ